MVSFKSAVPLVVAAAMAAGCGSSSSTPTTPTPTATTCSFSVGPPSTSTFAAGGGTATATVTTTSGCSWTATSNATFVSITSGSSGSGTGTVQFTVAANTATADRTGTLTIAGSTVTLTQRGATATAVTLSAPSAQTPIGGVTVDSARPTLTVANTTATGSPGTITYRFEVSDLSSFPNDAARTFTVDGVAQGSGSTTSWTLTRDLGPSVLWYWHARATNGSVTSDYSNVETFRTASACSYAVSPTTISAAGGGGTYTVAVTTTSDCSWTAVSNAAFITVTGGSSGTGSGTVTINVASSGGAAQSGTLTVAGQTVTVTQQQSGLVVQFNMTDPAAQPGPTTECRFRGPNGSTTTCTLQSTSFPLGATSIVNYAWTVEYTYGALRTQTQSGSSSSFALIDACGAPTSTTDGVIQPLSVTLTITDSAGNTATATSGSGSQPPLFVRLYTCGS